MGKFYISAVLMTLLFTCNAIEDFARNSGKFASKLYETIASGTDENIVISPVSVQTALGLAYLGADGTTAAEMSAGLLFDRHRYVVAENHKALLDHHAGSGVIMIANKIFLANEFEVNPTFMQLATEKLYSTAEKVDMSDGLSAVSTINRWVEGANNNKIKDLMKAGDVQYTGSVLVIAVYFKADWDLRFEGGDNKSEPFLISESQSKTVKMMHQRSDINYGDFDTFEAVQLQYKNADISMLLVLPKERTGLSQLEPRFMKADTDIGRFLGELKVDLVEIGLPKFKIEFEAKLKPALENMGMSTMFSSEANFSSLTSQPVQIGVIDRLQQVKNRMTGAGGPKRSPSE